MTGFSGERAVAPHCALVGLVGSGHFAGLMRKSGCAIVVLFLLLCVSAFVNGLLLLGLGARSASGIALETEPTSFDEKLVLPGNDDSDAKIVVIPMDGVIAYGAPGSLGDSMVEDLKAAFRQVANDPDVKAVVMTVDSPGGEITASDVIYHEIEKLKAKKPVVYFMNSIGASGAYYAACGASWVMCNETTFTGSIGVIISTLNYREALRKNRVGFDCFQEREVQGYAQRSAGDLAGGGGLRAGAGDAELR